MAGKEYANDKERIFGSLKGHQMGFFAVIPIKCSCIEEPPFLGNSSAPHCHAHQSKVASANRISQVHSKLAEVRRRTSLILQLVEQAGISGWHGLRRANPEVY